MSLFGLKCVYLKLKPIFLSVVYRPPSNGSDLDSTENLCAYLKRCEKQLPRSNEVLICGDLNCNMLYKYALSSKIKDLCSSLSLKQLIEGTYTYYSTQQHFA